MIERHHVIAKTKRSFEPVILNFSRVMLASSINYMISNFALFTFHLSNARQPALVYHKDMYVGTISL